MNPSAVCPTCTNVDVQPVLSVSAVQAADSIVLPSGDLERNRRLASHIRALWGTDDCRILKCAHCGFGFSWPYVAGDATFYNLANPYASYPSAKWEFNRTIEALKLRDTSDATILDVGAGEGFFLDLVSPDLIKAQNVTAVEYNDQSIAKLRKRGYTTVSADIRDAAFDDRAAAYDFVFLFQVVEHMDRLEELFNRLRYLLKPGGSIFVAVPNHRRVEYQESHDSVLDMPPNHIGRWTPNAFREIGKRCGLQVVASEFEPIDWREFVKHDLSYSHIRRTQLKPEGVLARIRSLPRGRFRRLAETVAAVLYTPARLGSWRAAYADRKNMGGALWVQLGHQDGQ
jgi:SAM-dependent methyltransferase